MATDNNSTGNGCLEKFGGLVMLILIINIISFIFKCDNNQDSTKEKEKKENAVKENWICVCSAEPNAKGIWKGWYSRKKYEHMTYEEAYSKCEKAEGGAPVDCYIISDK